MSIDCNHLLSAQVVGLLLRARKYNLVEVSLKSEFKDTFNFQINFIWTNWWYMIYDIIYIQNRMKLKFFPTIFLSEKYNIHLYMPNFL